jgi:hypothetical protein
LDAAAFGWAAAAKSRSKADLPEKLLFVNDFVFKEQK